MGIFISKESSASESRRDLIANFWENYQHSGEGFYLDPAVLDAKISSKSKDVTEYSWNQIIQQLGKTEAGVIYDNIDKFFEWANRKNQIENKFFNEILKDLPQDANIINYGQGPSGDSVDRAVLNYAKENKLFNFYASDVSLKNVISWYKLMVEETYPKNKLTGIVEDLTTQDNLNKDNHFQAGAALMMLHFMDMKNRKPGLKKALKTINNRLKKNSKFLVTIFYSSFNYHDMIKSKYLFSELLGMTKYFWELPERVQTFLYFVRNVKKLRAVYEYPTKEYFHKTCKEVGFKTVGEPYPLFELKKKSVAEILVLQKSN